MNFEMIKPIPDIKRLQFCDSHAIFHRECRIWMFLGKVRRWWLKNDEYLIFVCFPLRIHVFYETPYLRKGMFFSGFYCTPQVLVTTYVDPLYDIEQLIRRHFA